MIRVQTEDFDLLAENLKLRQNTAAKDINHTDTSVGAIVTFTGIVRDFVPSSKSLLSDENKNSDNEFYL